MSIAAIVFSAVVSFAAGAAVYRLGQLSARREVSPLPRREVNARRSEVSPADAEENEYAELLEAIENYKGV